MITRILKKIYAFLNFNAVNDPYSERMPLEKQKEFLSELPEPVDDYERSFYKYKCFIQYCYYKKKFLVFLFNLGAMFIYPFLMIKLRKNSAKTDRKGKKAGAVIENIPRLPNDDVYPEALKNEYDNAVEITEINYLKGQLGSSALAICREMKKRFFFHFYFRLIVMLKLAQFSSYIQQYNPGKIIFYSYEREFSGPLQTLLCEQENVEFISYMHGDYLYAIAFAFQRYTRFFVWDEWYRKMFQELRCSFDAEIYLPDKLKGIAEKKPPKACEFFATYYFSAETRDCAMAIRKVFDQFYSLNLRCKIRPHPRYSDTEMLKEVFSGVVVEDPREVSLAESISNSFYVIGLNTTVLSQAFYSGKEVVIDDISMEREYRVLKDKGYIMLNRPHLLLSEVCKQLAAECPYDESFRFASKSESASNRE